MPGDDGDRMEVLATLTQDLGKIFTAIRNITYAPKIDLIAALRKAMVCILVIR